MALIGKNPLTSVTSININCNQILDHVADQNYAATIVKKIHLIS